MSDRWWNAFGVLTGLLWIQHGIQTRDVPEALTGLFYLSLSLTVELLFVQNPASS